MPDQDRATAKEFVPKEKTALRLRVCIGFLCLRSDTGGRCAIVDLLVLQRDCLVVLLRLLQ